MVRYHIVNKSGAPLRLDIEGVNDRNIMFDWRQTMRFVRSIGGGFRGPGATLLFGTDWPLAPVRPYMQFVQEFIPEAYFEDVFYKTPCKFFRGLSPLSNAMQRSAFEYQGIALWLSEV